METEFFFRFSANSRHSTFAVNIFKHTTKIDGKSLNVEFWDTGKRWKMIRVRRFLSLFSAGQEKFDNLHYSYFHQAHACIMVNKFIFLSA